MQRIDLKLANYKGLKIKKRKLEVKEEEIKKALDYLQGSRAKIITVNRAAKKGDRVEIDFEIRQKEVKTEDGVSKNHPLILGKNRFLPGFENKLEGMKTGQGKEFSLKAPADWPDKRIAGKNLDFKVKMNLVQEIEAPDLNDEFAKSLGQFNSLSDLKKSVEQGLLQEKEIKEKQRIRIELIEKVAQDSEIKVSDILIKEELERIIEEFRANMKSIGLELEKYLEQIKKPIDELKKEWQEQAERRVRISLCLQAIIEQEGIEVSNEEVVERINQDLKQYPNVEEVEKNIDFEKLKEYTKNILKNEKVFELLEKETEII